MTYFDEGYLDLDENARLDDLMCVLRKKTKSGDLGGLFRLFNTYRSLNKELSIIEGVALLRGTFMMRVSLREVWVGFRDFVEGKIQESGKDPYVFLCGLYYSPEDFRSENTRERRLRAIIEFSNWCSRIKDYRSIQKTLSDYESKIEDLDDTECIALLRELYHIKDKVSENWISFRDAFEALLNERGLDSQEYLIGLYD